MPKRKTRGRGRGGSSGNCQRVSDIDSANKKRKLDPVPIGNYENDPIIENLKKFSWDRKVNFDISAEVLDQISLEGLSGISFSRLSYMLNAVSPSLNCVEDANAQTYIWSFVIKFLTSSSVKAYLNPPPKGATIDSAKKIQKQAFEKDPLKHDARSPNKRLLIDKEIKLPKGTIAQICKQECSLYAIQDGLILGSCENYLTRKDVTEDVLLISKKSNALEALSSVNEKYDLKNITFVADQELRRRAIMPDWSDPNVDVKMREYACLELIGRTRSLGVVFPNDKALGRYRILLTAKKFISQYQPKCTSHIIHHLVRFSKYISEPVEIGKIYKGTPASTKCDGAGNEVESDSDGNEFDDGDSIPSAKAACCLPRRLRIDRDMLKMVYSIIAYSKGRSPIDIRRKLRLPKFHVRNHLKNLANIELIGSHTKRIDDKICRIFRARHPSMVFRRNMREKMHKLKIVGSGKMKFDEVDLRAKSILGHRRSHFTQAEDSLLILCRICCLLIEPNLTKKVSFCVHKRFIRDLLHDELCESHDKTADACLRRIKYLRNLSNNIMSINELTAELRDEPDIIRLTSRRDLTKSEDKLNKLFTQILRVVRAKLPQLLGINLTAASNSLVSQRQIIQISSYDDLKSKYELLDCQATSTSRYKPHPGTTVLQLAQPLDYEYKLDLSECNEMPSIAVISSICTQNSFNIELQLKVPTVIVGLDQGNENYKQLCAKVKDTTRQLLSNLSTSNPAADSRRALFMLRNELKTQALDKCGNLADALIVQPCNVRFKSNDTIVFDQRDLIEEFLAESSFCASPRKQTNKLTMVPAFDTVDGLRKSPRKIGILRTRRKRRRAQDRDDGDQVLMAQSKLCSQSAITKSLFKAMELILSWTFVMPGIEFEKLYLKVRHLAQTKEQLLELLKFMERLDLVSHHKIECQPRSESVGIVKISDDGGPVLTYEPRSGAYIKFSQLLSLKAEVAREKKHE